ncbi:hypothetical protein CKAH01_06524 [Colletotrichum kahawae]|uniref:Uncharacterized protein n=1 Tax=Colletotrichum kahawae TaxID=34407 RepID=A0AAD9Y7R5_COLKA|nr:hypothetical protein CKAH01_06524 [Colletotrichum kahawae]
MPSGPLRDGPPPRTQIRELQLGRPSADVASRQQRRTDRHPFSGRVLLEAPVSPAQATGCSSVEHGEQTAATIITVGRPLRPSGH